MAYMMPTYPYRIHVNGHASPAGRPRAKQQRQSRCGRERRTTHTDTLLRIHAHIPPSLCASAARLLFPSLPCFPPTLPRVPCIEALPAIFIQKQRRGRGRNCNVVEGERGGGQPNPGRQVADDQVAAQAKGEGRKTCRKTPHLPRGRVRGLGTGATAHRAWLKRIESYSVQRRDNNRWACLAAPTSQFGARCAPLRPSWSLLRRPWAAVFGGHIHASRLPM
ncbi:uncharacterized protein BDZ83DRAFT_30572 [Colletotrichum acutatum]|uniref:Uncharacterized protein n=1 Tax=Glomerella acutata TaxID=27357 RepID=A0AAD8UB18_GLOAC|nr:uncharacterized protein BDZ83DRAFT_30572 [Colletotrichum acutatum]KAK1717350.1 hypothetical protein BDZ83DRAFT_30572 [Colletotrichum acutatum]